MTDDFDVRSPVLVAGAGGFIGGHLVADLRRRGYSRIRAVDSKPLGGWYQLFRDVDNRSLDLRDKQSCYIASGVYAADKQTSPDVIPLRESDAYRAQPEDGYGWEKLFSERMCRHFSEDYGLETRAARYHNVYGPDGTYDGGREKAPAAICRKVIFAKLTGNPEIEIWGDGEQTRSLMYIEDCVEGTQRLMRSDIGEPLNIGSDQLVTINRLVDIVENIAGVRLRRRYLLDAPKGVRGRNSDNTMIRRLLGWAPSISLETGLEHTYRWIYDQMIRHHQPQKSLLDKEAS